MESLWDQTSVRIPGDASPPLDSDVIIAGAGLTGLSLATLLHRQGMRVMVVEAREVGAVTTGRTTGKVSLLQGTVLSSIRRHAGEEVLRAYVASNRVAQDWMRAEFSDEPDTLHSDPAVTYATSAEGLARLEREDDAARSAGVDVERLVRPHVAELGLPFPVEAALRLEDQLRVHPMRALAKLARTLRQEGVRIVTGCRVTGAHADADGVMVQTTKGDVRASLLVLAAGAAVLDGGALFPRLSPSRSFVVSYDLAAATPPPRGMFLSVDDASRSLRRDDVDGTWVLTVGGGAHVPGRRSDQPAMLAEIDDWTRGHWPGARRRTWWAAQDYSSVTHVPFAGALAHSNGRVFAATGYAKWGMTNAVASAMRIAGAIAHRDEDWAAVLTRHHVGLADLGEAIEVNAAVGGHLVADWVGRGVVATTRGVPQEGEGRIVRAGMSPVAESTVDGVTRRLSGVCTHLGGVVSWNEAECSWDCPLHGSRFSAEGEVLEGPAVQPLEAIQDGAAS